MSKPLTENQLITLAMTGDGRTDRQYKVAQAAIARLDYLERKVQAADVLARKLAASNGLLLREREALDDEATYGIASLEAQIEVNRAAIAAYDEVIE